ncbi:hypothetical protein B0H12DRAFT_1116345 [Mycena haematopus]|nr:hypothetical protein B0H12DRAFT_1116345 [Mycena haematopus]
MYAAACAERHTTIATIQTGPHTWHILTSEHLHRTRPKVIINFPGEYNFPPSSALEHQPTLFSHEDEVERPSQKCTGPFFRRFLCSIFSPNAEHPAMEIENRWAYREEFSVRMYCMRGLSVSSC